MYTYNNHISRKQQEPIVLVALVQHVACKSLRTQMSYSSHPGRCELEPDPRVIFLFVLAQTSSERERGEQGPFIKN